MLMCMLSLYSYVQADQFSTCILHHSISTLHALSHALHRLIGYVVQGCAKHLTEMHNL